MASTRLRKTFHFPSDSESSDEDSRPEMDEEEQENLIQDLKTKEKSSNELYTLLFTLFPLISSGTLIPSLLAPRSTANIRILSLLGITALVATAYICAYIPPTLPSSPKSRGQLPASVARHLGTGFGEFAPPMTGPVGRWLVPLTSVISMMLGIAAWGLRGRKGVEEGFWVLCGMPAVVFWIVMVARRFMGSTAGAIGELEGRRYRFKGA